MFIAGENAYPVMVVHFYSYIYGNQSKPAVATLFFLFLNTPYSPSSQHVSAFRAIIK
jgi:hypothetical protein